MIIKKGSAKRGLLGTLSDRTLDKFRNHKGSSVIPLEELSEILESPEPFNSVSPVRIGS